MHRANATRKAHDVQYYGQNPVLIMRTNNYTLLFNIFKNSYIPKNRLCQSLPMLRVGPQTEALYSKNVAVLRIIVNKKKSK